MPYRKTPLATGETYHLIVRGVAQLPIFADRRDRIRLFETLYYYRYNHPPLRLSFYLRLPHDQKKQVMIRLKKCKQLIDIYAYCLMDNHIHLLLKQNQENGISIFMRRALDSFARYNNTKSGRIGPLFQAMFRAVRIETDEQLVHVSRYIHLNPVTAFLIEGDEIESYEWSSFLDYISLYPRKNSFINRDVILEGFKDRDSYHQFVLDQVDYQRELAKIRSLILEKVP